MPLSSGNHGGDKKIDIPAEMAPTIPKQSQNVFVAPDAILKNSPSIKDLIKEPVPQTSSLAASSENKTNEEGNTHTTETKQPENQNREDTPTTDNAVEVSIQDSDAPSNEAETTPEPITSPAPTPQAEELPETEDNPAQQSTENEPVPPATTPIENASPLSNEDFLTVWNNMVEVVFNKVPTLYSSLKHSALTHKDHTIYLTFKNDQQENDFNIKKIEALRVLREADNTINDIVTKVDHQLATKKYIIDDTDKMQELRRQNVDIDDFLTTLNLRVH